MISSSSSRPLGWWALTCDRRAAKAVYGESKVYLEVGGRPLVAHVVAALQRVPEVSEVWVVGKAERLNAVFARDDNRRETQQMACQTRAHHHCGHWCDTQQMACQTRVSWWLKDG